MAVVAVAGGLGDLGRLIAEALFEAGKFEVYIMSRKAVDNNNNNNNKNFNSGHISPLTGKHYQPIIQTDYSSEDALIEQLTGKHVKVVISALIMDSDSASDAQLRLIRAADQSPCVKRFIPSEFNVEYDVSDDVLPYPEKKFHLAARQELGKTATLEFAYIYPGMFMDYFGMPRIATSLRPLCFFIDPVNGQAVLPGDGEAMMSMTLTTDAARYIAMALDLDKWPRIMTTAASTISLNELVRLVEKHAGRHFRVRYQPVEKLLNHEPIDLPTNLDIANQFPERFPGGLGQLRALIADLEAGVALGAFDFGKLGGHLDLVEAFEGHAPAPKRIEELIEETWRVDAGHGPNTYSQPYGFQEVLYNAISVPPGSPGLFLICSAVTFSHTPSSPSGRLSSYELAPLLRNAWLQLRQQYPTLAAENRAEGKVYTSPSSHAELERWLATTFIITPGKTYVDLWKTMVKTKHMTMYFCPDKGQLCLQGEHHTLDGRGILNFWDRFFKALASPAKPQELMRTDGSEVSRLPPRSDDLLDTAERKAGRGEEHALEILAPLVTMHAPISMPVARPLLRCSRQNMALELRVGARTTQRIMAACKAQRLSVTAAWHTAVVFATQAIQAKGNALELARRGRSGEAGTQFAAFGNFDLRRYFPAAPEDESLPDDAYALGNHHGVLPYVVNTEGKSFSQVAQELGGFYQRDLPKADPEVWSALGPMIQMMVPEFTKPQLEETTPALSSLGVVDKFIASSYADAEGRGSWQVKDVWFGDTVTGPWLEHFMWAWQGQLSLNTCYNPAYYTRDEVDEFNQLVVGKMLDGLGAVGRGPGSKI
ncbi:hypothetical protein B0H63DRAFT_533512 [Podospora didyma]|uniref:NmrA-like domain-containing protein n=1 Tax=Podospora didyma TaxID=330526 RepID=A0AAE0P7Y4_9PEZI|nr:hypothetical protein B0H63DRAFT_533512 [Podospora didyma]